MESYATSLQHILAELERVDLFIRIQVWRARQRNGDQQEESPLFYIPETEVDALLEKTIGPPTWASVALPVEIREVIQARLDVMAADIAGRTAESLRQNIYLRLVTLAYLFDLTEFDTDAILIGLAPELDQRYERLYAYLHDDLTRRRPSVDLILNLLCFDLETKIAARAHFTPVAPLLRHHLVQLADDPDQRPVGLLSKTLQLDPHLVHYLLDGDEIDGRLQPYVQFIEPTTSLDELFFPEEFKQKIFQLSQYAQADRDDLVLYFQGPDEWEKRAAVGACCHALDATLLAIHGKRLATLRVEEFETLVQLIDREARLQGAVLYWENFDALLVDERDAHLAAVLSLLETHPGPTFLSGETTWEPVSASTDLAFLRLEFPQPGSAERLDMWRAALAGDGRTALAPALDLALVANKFRLSGGQIHDAAATARNLARTRDPATPQVIQVDLYAACRLRSNRKLAQLAQKITPHYTWDDIVLPADQMDQLREIHDQVQYRGLIYDTWGFERKLAMGKGLSVLFSGPPGTGKTMAADVLAHSLGLDLYKIDLSGVVSKYIGETEKNLARIFAEAGTSNAILFFDEADALFGKRTQVRDAHDRYANIEISYLLQKMEEYEGLIILATNLSKNMDDAFVRRLHFAVELSAPDVADRLRIWEGIWPSATPREPDLDLDYLSRHVELAGGAIRNIVLASAFLAAADGGVVTMQHLIRATRREYQKMGKVLTGTDFEEYTK